MTQRFLLYLFAFVAGISFFGCESTCTYPDLQTFRLRLLNAMPDQKMITVFINGKRFKKDYTYAPPADFGYINTYEDGTPLPLGDSLLVVVTSDALGADTLHKGFISPNLHRQTLIIMGRGKKLVPADPSTTRHLLLDDEDVVSDGIGMKIRFVHAVPDLPALDIFFNGTVLDTPDITISYGQSTERLQVESIPGLTITEAENPDNIIVQLPFEFGADGFIVTAVIRGSAKPVDSEPIPAPIVLSDEPLGLMILDFPTFGVRLVNGMRDQILSLLVENPPPHTPSNPPGPRNNVSGQRAVFDIRSDSVGKYFGIGQTALGKGKWFFSRDKVSDTVFSFLNPALANQRWSLIAVEGKKLGEPGLAISHMAVLDTMSHAFGSFTRVRVINLSPDHTTISFTLGGRTVSMGQKDIEFFTVPTGVNTIEFSDGVTQRTYNLDVKPGSRPISLFILPDKTGSSYPVALSTE